MERPTACSSWETTHRDRRQEDSRWHIHFQDPSKVRLDRYKLCFFSRYGETWTEKHQLNGGDDDGEEETLELSETESITSIDGVSNDGGGNTWSLLAETSQGKTWGPHGYHKPDLGDSLRPSPRGNIKLAFISGDETRDKWILR